MIVNWQSLAPVIWLVLGILFAVTEGLSVQLVSIWFAVGAAITAAVAALFPVSGLVQFWIFLVVSLLLLVCTRPIAKKMLHVKKETTNADQVIGQTAKVIQSIDNDLGLGRVFVMGLDWAARTKDDSFVAEGDRVRILAIDGVKLIVERCEAETTSE